MNKRTTIIISVFLAFVLGVSISYMFTPTTDDILYTVLDDSSIESHITKSYMSDGNLIIDIYNPNCEIVKVKPATIEYHVTASMDLVKIFNYTDQYFEVIVGNASDVYTFGSLTKTWDAKNKTVIIGTSDSEPLLTIERVSINPDLCTFEEVLNITSYVDYELNNLKDFRSRWRQVKGTNNITSVDWYIQKNQSYNVVVPEYGLIEQSQIIPNIIEYEDVTTAWMCGDCALGNCDSSQYWNISRNTANGTESRTICFDSYEVLQANPLKIKIYWNETGVISSHNETNYRNVWKQFSPIGKTIHAGQSYIIKAVYYKKPELGDVRIQTIPLFRGMECDELTWWNTSWSKRVEKTINNASVALTDYQIMNVTAYDTDMNANFSDLRFTNDTGTSIPYWIESKTDSSTADIWLKIPSISTTEGATVWMYYGNSNVSSTSSIDDVMILGELFSGSLIDAVKWNPTGTWTVSGGTAINTQSGAPVLVTDNEILSGHTDYIVESRGRARHNCGGMSITSETLSTGVYSTGYDNRWVYTYSTTGGPQFKVDNVLKSNPAYDCVVNTWYRNKMIINPSGTHYSYLYSDGGSLLVTASTTDDSSSSTGYLAIHARDGIAEIDYIFVRKYTATEPTWGADGAEEAPATGDITITSYAPTTPITLEASTSQLFNVTVDNNSQCRWYLNTSLVQTNSSEDTNHLYTNGSLNVGHWNFTAYVNGSTDNDSQTWWVTVTSLYKPPEPVNLTNTTGNFWANHTWESGAGNVTDAYNVSVNGTWYNRTYAWYNETYSAHGWQNISVWAWNNSREGTISD